jgi:FimV-like protein
MITIHNHFLSQKISASHAKLVSFIFAIVIALFAVQTLSAEMRYRVKSSDNLNDIVERFYQGSDLSKGQLMVGVLIKNPNAFRGGNINFLLRGKRLTLPNESDLQQISPDSASEVLSEHARFFRFGITGDLSPPTLSEMTNNSPDEKGETSNSDDSDELLSKQKSQAVKIDKLQQESDDLRKQLEELVNEKSDRDQRLLELEASLKETLSTKKASPAVDSAKANDLEKSNEQLQKKLTETKSKLAVNSNENKVLERKVENLKEVLSDNASSGNNGVTRTIESSGSILTKLAWLIPLLLLGLFLYYYFEKKKHNPHVDDYSETIETGKAGYIEPHDTVHAEEDAYEDDSLETSVKLDVARAYIEAEDTQSALDILTEIMEEGTDEQRKVAHELLEKISPS